MIPFDHSYLRDLAGTFVRTLPDPAPDPALLVWNAPLARDLGLADGVRDRAAHWLSGAEVPPGADPVALAYAGHQFGGFSPQLGDGRAHLLGEIVTPKGRVDLQLKGSGRTVFSRGGDGKAVLGPMLREYLISEAMAALGVPTTRSLSVVLTGKDVWREAGRLPGAVLARVAASHIRVGTFQFLAARGDTDRVRMLADHAMARHYPEVTAGDYPAFFDAVADRQVRLIAQWMGLGFVHGVMNTDNMAISGETIDYGPCAFLDAYAPGAVFSSIDRQGRYAYANQPLILGWNLARLAETLLPLWHEDRDQAVAEANARLQGIAPAFRAAHLAVMRRKLGLPGEEPGDGALIDDFLAALVGADWTLTFWRLGGEDPGAFRVLFDEFTAMADWLPRWRDRGGDAAQVRAMNPAVIPRNHLVEAALDAATEGDLAPFEALVAAVQSPMTWREPFSLAPPAGLAPYVTYCGT
jgi:serine/tyrosine/threonine adenylyltransferase